MADEGAERMNQADRENPDYALYLHGGEDPWDDNERDG